jgi:hypothetical protein
MLDQFLETWMLLTLLVIRRAQKTEVVSHDEVPLLQLVQHLQFLNFVSFGLVNAVVVTV